VDMGRCTYCYSVVTKTEDFCYMCGDSVPRQKKSEIVVHRPVSGWTNTLFLVSLAFTVYGFVAAHRLSLPTTLEISGTLLILKVVAERFANRNMD